MKDCFILHAPGLPEVVKAFCQPISLSNSGVPLSEGVPAQQAAIQVYQPRFCLAMRLTIASAVGFSSLWVPKKTRAEST